MWIQIDDSIAEHDKIYNLADALNIPNAHAVGLMTCLWCWAIKATPGGEVTNFPARALAKAAGWEKKAEQFFDAICSEKSLFIERRPDGRLFFRNWETRAEMLIDAVNRKKEQTKTRVERYRERKNKNESVTESDGNANVMRYKNVTQDDCNADVTQECNAEKANVTPLPEPVPEPVPVPYSTLSPVALPPEDVAHDGNESERENIEKSRKTNKDTATLKTDAGAEDFSEFWMLYPRKHAIGEAEEVWRRINPTKALCQQIIEAVKKAIVCDEWQKENGRFIPHPAKWLDQKRWLDEPVANVQQSASEQTPVLILGEEQPRKEPTEEQLAEIERLKKSLSETPAEKKQRELREKHGG